MFQGILDSELANTLDSVPCLTLLVFQNTEIAAFREVQIPALSLFLRLVEAVAREVVQLLEDLLRAHLREATRLQRPLQLRVSHPRGVA